MKISNQSRRLGGYLMNEALVYIGLVFVILGAGYFVTYRAIENSVMLRKNAEDIAAAMRAGERWRADIRRATHVTLVPESPQGSAVHLSNQDEEVVYRFQDAAVFRSAGGGPEIRVLEHVKSSVMQANPRQHVVPWRWEVELLPRSKGYSRPSRVQPLFTFTAVPREVRQ